MIDAPKCYLVSSGSYSDYGINAVFLTRDEAEVYRLELIESNRRPDEVGTPRHEVNDVEEMPLGRPDGKRLTASYHARINLLTGECEPLSNDAYSPFVMVPAGMIRSEQQSKFLRADDVATIRTSFVSQEHAEKLCIEARQEWLRMNAATVAPAFGQK